MGALASTSLTILVPMLSYLIGLGAILVTRCQWSWSHILLVSLFWPFPMRLPLFLFNLHYVLHIVACAFWAYCLMQFSLPDISCLHARLVACHCIYWFFISNPFPWRRHADEFTYLMPHHFYLFLHRSITCTWNVVHMPHDSHLLLCVLEFFLLFFKLHNMKKTKNKYL